MSAMQPGRYRAKAIGHKLGKASTGNEQVLVNFEVTDGEHKGRIVYWYGTFTEASIERTLESLEHAGWDGVSLSQMSGLGDREVELVMENELGQDGQNRLRVRWVNKMGGAMKVELDRGGVMALEERIKGAMLARKQKRDDSSDDSFEFGANRRSGDGPPV
jgi:hypothetical protein